MCVSVGHLEIQILNMGGATHPAYFTARKHTSVKFGVHKISFHPFVSLHHSCGRAGLVSA